MLAARWGEELDVGATSVACVCVGRRCLQRFFSWTREYPGNCRVTGSQMILLPLLGAPATAARSRSLNCHIMSDHPSLLRSCKDSKRSMQEKQTSSVRGGGAVHVIVTTDRQMRVLVTMRCAECIRRCGADGERMTILTEFSAYPTHEKWDSTQRTSWAHAQGGQARRPAVQNNSGKSVSWQDHT